MAGLRAEITEPEIARPNVEKPYREEEILPSQAVEFLRALHRRFASRRKDLLTERLWRQRQFDRGNFPEFLRGRGQRPDSEWALAPIPQSLRDLRVLVAGPPEWDALARGLTSGAGGFVADFDDRSSPLWAKCLEHHADSKEAAGRFALERAGNPGSNRPVLFLRPRNWTVEEMHFTVDGAAIPASLFDFGLFLFHNARTLLAGRSGPCFSLPKLEGHLEARLWRDIFTFSEEYLDIPQGSIRAIVTIETLSAVFEMEEILFELRDYAFALECSPSNYLSSYIQALRAHGKYLLPECNDLSMEQPFLHAYRELLVHACHKRGALAIGSCQAQLPGYDHAKRNQWARTVARVNAMQEAQMGFDATSVAAIELVPVVLAAVAECLPRTKPAGDGFKKQCYISSTDLISRARGQITRAALQENVEVALGYLEAFLSGRISIEASGRAESMATAELCRAQLWQWSRHSARLTAGHRVDRKMIECLIRDASAAAASRLGRAASAASKLSAAGEILLEACTGEFESPLAAGAYAHLG